MGGNSQKANRKVDITRSNPTYSFGTPLVFSLDTADGNLWPYEKYIFNARLHNNGDRENATQADGWNPSSP